MTTEKKKKRKAIVDISEDKISIELKEHEDRPSIKWQRFKINKNWTYLYAISQGKIFLEYLVNRQTGNKITVTNFMSRREFEKFNRHKKMATKFYEKYTTGTKVVPEWYQNGAILAHQHLTQSSQ